MTHLLVTAKANINHQNDDDETPLLNWSIYNSKEECFVPQLLIKKGARVDIEDENGNTFLKSTAKDGSY